MKFRAETQKSLISLFDSGNTFFCIFNILKVKYDSESDVTRIVDKIVRKSSKPYYLFHSDPVKGLKHFLVPLERGLSMMYNLYDRMSGLAMPHYCFNAPGGGGHVLLNNNYVSKVSEGHYRITTFEGNEMDYYESLD